SRRNPPLLRSTTVTSPGSSRTLAFTLPRAATRGWRRRSSSLAWFGREGLLMLMGVTSDVLEKGVVDVARAVVSARFDGVQTLIAERTDVLERRRQVPQRAPLDVQAP